MRWVRQESKLYFLNVNLQRNENEAREFKKKQRKTIKKQGKGEKENEMRERGR